MRGIGLTRPRQPTLRACPGAVKVERCTGRSVLTATSADAPSKATRPPTSTKRGAEGSTAAIACWRPSSSTQDPARSPSTVRLGWRRSRPQCGGVLLVPNGALLVLNLLPIVCCRRNHGEIACIRLIPDSAGACARWKRVHHVAARACRGREVARIDREAAPNVRRVLDVFFAEQLLTVVAAQR